MFYSDKPQELAATVHAFLAKATPAGLTKPVKAIIAPHAGYIYSGPVAGTAYASLAGRAGDIERVIVLGPCHRVAFPGVAASSAQSFDTPLGPVAVDRDKVASLCKEGLAREFDHAYAQEHSLEVQLPFLKILFPEARIVPLLAGDENSELVEKVLEYLWGEAETAIVISSDLSHYHDYATAQKLDRETAQAMEGLSPSGVDREQACGSTGINGLLAFARNRKLTCTTLDLRNSGDTAGPRNRVVGYGAFAVQ
jgi:AmmeMemoRadiSam system protein B